MVRSNKKKEIGFLKDWRRMNVAVTRARRMLVLIGNGDCVSKDHYIGSLVKWIEEHGKMVSGLEFEGDPLVRFGEGVSDEEDYNQGNNQNN
jgi:ATP-dependent RNA/DNA helicase IGHMBP2